MNIPKFRNIKGTLYIDKETYNRDVMQVKEYKEDEIDRLNNIVNGLQSKIDKANQYLEERFIFDDENGEYYQTHTFDKDNAKELHDILKENKNAKD